MGERISCLIIDKDPETIRHVDVLGRKLGTIDLRWKTGAIDTGIDIIRKHLPEMAIVGLGPEPEAEIESIAAISREFPAVYLLVLSDSSDADLILRTMRAGANDFLCKPVKESDLRAATEKIHKLMASRKEAAVKGGKILSVFCNKGGNGTTTIAVNLADALSRYHGKKVVVVDLVLVNGDVTMFFNVAPDYSILDLAKNAGEGRLRLPAHPSRETFQRRLYPRGPAHDRGRRTDLRRAGEGGPLRPAVDVRHTSSWTLRTSSMKAR